jgi:protein-disulfide isomerase
LIRITTYVLAMAAAGSLLVAGCSRAAEDPAFGDKVRAYLLAHPEVIEEAVQKLQDQKDAQAAQKAKLALSHDRQSLERDPRDFVANPNGRITVTEFYDYRCPHCINAAPAVLKIIQDNPDVRFVFKELPIFGAVSEHAAREAIAIKDAGGDYLGFYKTLMATRGLDDATVDKVAKSYGVDPAKAQEGPLRQSADAEIADVHKLANDVDVEGTPTFIIGDTVVPGEDMDAVKDAIAKARKDEKAS